MNKLFKKIFCLLLAIALVIPFIKVRADGQSRVQIINADGGGTFTVTGGSFDSGINHDSTLSDFVDKGISLKLKATPDSYHLFVGWFNCEEVDISNGNGVMGWVPKGESLTANEEYTLNISEDYYNIMPVFDTKFGHNNIWLTGEGEIAVLYENRDSSTQGDLDGNHWASNGIVVDYLRGDEITLYARAKEGNHFVGWFITDPQASDPANYVKEPIVSSNKTFTYKPDETTISGVSEPINYLTAVFEPGEETSNKKDYTVSNENAIATFEFDAGHNFSLNFFNVLDYTLEEINTMTGSNVSKEEFDQILSAVKEEIKEYGTLIGLYAIEINDGNSAYTGEVNFKIKLTDEMKKYNTFKLIYLDDTNGMKALDVADFKIEGDYIVGKLPHLSAYVLVGSNISSPQTGDNLITSIIMLVVSIIGLSTIGLYLKNKKTN